MVEEGPWASPQSRAVRGNKVIPQNKPSQGPPQNLFSKNEPSSVGTNSYFLPKGFHWYGNGSVLELIFFFFLLQVKNLGKFQQEENLQDPAQQFML